jgi:hypothetical protein
MNWISKIFSKRDSANVNEMIANADTNFTREELMPAITEDLFVDHHAPEFVQNEEKVTGIGIQAFLEQDFHHTGYNDGYNYHNQEIMLNRIKGIKETFRLLIDFTIERKRQKLLELRSHGIEIDGLSERIKRKVEAIETTYRDMIERLDREKERSADEEGWVMKPIYDYRDGFLRGAEQYNEEKIFATSTGMFN